MNQLFVSLGIEAWKPWLSNLVMPPIPFLLLVLIGARLLPRRRGPGWTVLLLGLVGLFIATRNMGGGAATAGTQTAGTSANGSTSGSTTDNQAAAPTAAAQASDPPRMSLETFKQLYDDPAKRPLIIDVRAAQSYQEGHIKGAVSIPETDVDARLSEIPKDKLVVAYCQ
jgi:hypothetical protein